MKSIITLVGLSIAFQFIAPDASAQTASAYKNYIDTAKAQIDQNNLEIERIKLMQAEYRAHRNEAAAKSKDAEIKRYQNINVLKQQEISMYQQMDSLMKQPLSTNPKIAVLQDGIRRINIEKAQLGLRQTEATQSGNVAEAARIAQQIKALQLQIPPKEQEIRLVEMQSKIAK